MKPINAKLYSNLYHERQSSTVIRHNDPALHISDIAFVFQTC